MNQSADRETSLSSLYRWGMGDYTGMWEDAGGRMTDGVYMGQSDHENTKYKRRLPPPSGPLPLLFLSCALCPPTATYTTIVS
jgi:hypothetical protein